jgi:hypothetical protein
MQQSPSQACSCLPDSETPRLACDMNVLTVLKSPSIDFILKRLNSVHTITPNFLNIRLNIILPYKPRSNRLALFFRLIFPTGLRYVLMHTIKADGDEGSGVQHIFNLSTRWR